jgi:hypothetical protein
MQSRHVQRNSMLSKVKVPLPMREGSRSRGFKKSSSQDGFLQTYDAKIPQCDRQSTSSRRQTHSHAMT